MKITCNFNIFLYFSLKKRASRPRLAPTHERKKLFYQRINTFTHSIVIGGAHLAAFHTPHHFPQPTPSHRYQ